MSREPEKKPFLITLLDRSEEVVYYGAALALLVTVGVLFVSAVESLLAVFEAGPLDTSLAVLDRVLLIFIFVKLLNTIGVIVRKHENIAEPFLIVDLIAVVRRILLVTAELRAGGTGEIPGPHPRTRGIDGARDLARRRPLLHPPRRTRESWKRRLTPPVQPYQSS